MKIQGKVFVAVRWCIRFGCSNSNLFGRSRRKLLMVDMNQELGLEMQQRLGEQSVFVKLDVTDEHAVKVFFDNIEQEYGQLNGLVNCAGIAPSAKVLGRDGIHDFAMFQKVLNINVNGTFNMIRFAANLIAKYQLQAGEEERGVIVNTASVAAFDGQIGQSAYAASKGAVVAMTLPLARELAREAIRVMTIAPGIMETLCLKACRKMYRMLWGRWYRFHHV